jgi:hypothetical protein
MAHPSRGACGGSGGRGKASGARGPGWGCGPVWAGAPCRRGARSAVERAARPRRSTVARGPGSQASPRRGTDTGAGGPRRWRGVGSGSTRRGPCVVGGASAGVAEAHACGVAAWSREPGSSSWRWGASSPPGSDPRGQHAKRRERSVGVAAGVSLGAGGGGPCFFRALPSSRRREGGAADRPAGGRRKTPRASGAGCGDPHGEQVVGDARSQGHRQPPA